MEEDEEEEGEEEEDREEEEEGGKAQYARFYPFPFTERVIEQPEYPPGPERDALDRIRRDGAFCRKLRGGYYTFLPATRRPSRTCVEWGGLGAAHTDSDDSETCEQSARCLWPR